MINGQSVGCGVVTYNRPEQLMRLYRSLPQHLLDGLVIVNDGQWYEEFAAIPQAQFVQNEQNLGVGPSKNKALKHLLAQQFDHYFLIEDDLFVLDETVFERYISASAQTGIQHFNYSQHGLMNKSQAGEPAPRVVIDFNAQLKLPLYTHCVGAFSYYSKACLATVGLMDENFRNAFEHVEHTLKIIKAGMHPPFWYFADVPQSWLLLGDDGWSVEQSTIASKDDRRERLLEAATYFKSLHGVTPVQMPDTSQPQLAMALSIIKGRFASAAQASSRQAPVVMRPRAELPEMLLAQAYCQGVGLEVVGANDDAFCLAGCLTIAPSDGVGALLPQDLAQYEQARARSSGQPVGIDALGDFQTLPVPDSQADYLISAHAIERVPNVIAALGQTYRALKDHGIFFNIFTKRDQVPGDACRAVTTLAEFSEAAAQQRDVANTPSEPWRGHYQVFSLQSMLGLVNHLNQQGDQQWYIEAFEETDTRTGRGHTLVLRKFSAMTQVRWHDEEASSAAVAELIEQGKHEDALLMLKVSLSYDFFDAQKLHLVGLLSHHLGDEAEAVEFFQQSLLVNPENAECRAHYLQIAGKPYRNPLV